MDMLIDMLKENNYEFSVFEGDIFVPIGNVGIYAIRWNSEQEVFHLVSKWKDDEDRIYRYICNNAEQVLELLQDEL